MLEISPKTNLLEQKNYRYSLQDVDEPNLYRDIYDYESVPKVPFNHRRVPMGMPEEIWISDTSFRDGQQSVDPYTVEQIVDLYKLMSKLGGPYGIIRQTEFFIYSKKDREAVERCKDLGLNLLFETGAESPLPLMRLIHESGLDNLYINLDTGNGILYGTHNPVDALYSVGHLVRNLHMKDALPPVDCYELGTTDQQKRDILNAKLYLEELLKKYVQNA